MAGGAYGIVLVVIPALLRPDEVSGGTLLVSAAVGTVRSAALGALAGLVALLLQRTGARR